MLQDQTINLPFFHCYEYTNPVILNAVKNLKIRSFATLLDDILNYYQNTAR